MEIRRLTPDDALKAQQTIRTLKTDRGGRAGAFASLDHLKSVLANDDLYLIASFDRDTPVGYLYAYRLPRVDRDQEMILLYDIEVAPTHRRRGIGKALVNRLREECRDRDVMKTWVITERSNMAAVHLYKSTGAKPQEVEDTVVYEWGEK